MAHWVHGSVTYRNRVVEVREVFSVMKGHPKRSLGWEAKIDLGGAVALTVGGEATQNAAERKLIDALAEFTRDE